MLPVSGRAGGAVGASGPGSIYRKTFRVWFCQRNFFFNSPKMPKDVGSLRTEFHFLSWTGVVPLGPFWHWYRLEKDGSSFWWTLNQGTREPILDVTLPGSPLLGSIPG